MKRITAFLVCALLCAALTVTAQASRVCQDAETGVSFLLPGGWREVPVTVEDDLVDRSFVYVNDAAFLSFGVLDLWQTLSSTEPSFPWSRSQLCSDTLSERDADALFGDTIPAKIVYNDRTYYSLELEQLIAPDGTVLGAGGKTMAYLKYGYLIAVSYSYLHTAGNTREADLFSVLDSMDYSALDARTEQEQGENSPISSTMLDLLVSLLITVTIYSLPIAVYRYGIRRRYVEKKLARRITIFYGAGAFLLMSVILTVVFHNGVAGGAILLWSSINYRILTSGAPHQQPDPPAEAHTTPKDAAPLEAAERCGRCGGQIDPGTHRCTRCQKQYFRFTAGLAVSLVLGFALVVSAALHVQQSRSAAALRETIDALQLQNAELQGQSGQREAGMQLLENRLAIKDEKLRDLNEQLNTLQDGEDLYSRYIVLVGDSWNRCYHKYSCTLLPRSFWTLWIDDAIAAGYQPCPLRFS